MRIKELMKKNVWTLKKHQSIYEASVLMRIHDIGSIVIVDDSFNVEGIITDRDILIFYSKHHYLDAKIEDAMTKSVLTINENEYPEDVSDLMGYAQIRRVPIVNDDGKLKGIVSLGDLAINKKLDELSKEALTEISVSYNDKPLNSTFY